MTIFENQEPFTNEQLQELSAKWKLLYTDTGAFSSIWQDMNSRQQIQAFQMLAGKANQLDILLSGLYGHPSRLATPINISVPPIGTQAPTLAREQVDPIEQAAAIELMKSAVKELQKYEGERSAIIIDTWLEKFAKACARMRFSLDSFGAMDLFEQKLGAEPATWLRNIRNQSPGTLSSAANAMTALRLEYYPVGDVREAIRLIKQFKQGKNSMEEHIAGFRKLLIRAPNMAVADQVDAFLEGIKDHISIQILTQTSIAKTRESLTLQDVTTMALTLARLSNGARSDPPSTPHYPTTQEPDAMNIDAINARNFTPEQLIWYKSGKCYMCGGDHYARDVDHQRDSNGGWEVQTQGRYKGRKGRKEGGKDYNRYDQANQLGVKSRASLHLSINKSFPKSTNITRFAGPVSKSLQRVYKVLVLRTQRKEQAKSYSTMNHALQGEYTGHGRVAFQERKEKYLQDRADAPPISIRAMGTSASKDDRFLFKATVNGHNMAVLLDTGSQAMVVGDDLVRRLGIKTRKAEPITAQYANQTTELIDRTLYLKMKIGDYYKTMEFYVADIGEEVIMGIPFIQSIHFNYQLWIEQRFGFTDLETGRKHTWIGQGEEKCQQSTVRVAMLLRKEEFARYHNVSWDRRGVISIASITHDAATKEDTTNDTTNSLRLDKFLHKYRGRFKEPTKTATSSG